MRDRIFHSILFVCLCSLICTSIVFLLVLNSYFNDSLRQELEVIAQLADDEDDLSRIDWASHKMEAALYAPNGDLLFKSRADRPDYEDREVKFEKKLANGTLLVLSKNKLSISMQVLGMLQPLCFVLVIGILVALFLSNHLAKQLIKPLNELDLDHPVIRSDYLEIAPLIQRLLRQQKKIKYQEQQLKQRHEELKTLTNGIQHGIILLNQKNIILHINDAAKKLSPLPVGIQGTHFLQMFNDRKIEEALLDHPWTKKVVRVEWNDQILAFNIDPIVSNHQLIGHAILILEVGERERIETIRREFSSNVSHELKTPIQSILGYSELLSSDLVKEADQKQFIQMIHTKALQMKTIVEETLKLSKIEKEIDRYSFESIDLKAQIEQCLQNHRRAIQLKKIEVDLDLEDASIQGQANLVSMIFNNLIENAIKYNKEGGKIKIGLKSQGEDQALVSIEDTGIGIIPEEQGRIFERFYRSNSIRASIPGSGIGLSIVKHAMLILQGKIEVRSEVHKGTRFILRFENAKK